jgi:5'-3' exonuclease
MGIRLIVDSKLMAYNTQHRSKPIVSLFDDLARIIKYLHDKTTVGVVDEIIFVYDIGKSTYRLQLLPSYKGHRTYGKTHEEFNKDYQDITPDIAKNLGINTVGVPGVEADDLAGILLGLLEKKKTLFITADQDWFQFVFESNKAAIFDPRTYKLYTKRKVIEHSGCTTLGHFLMKKALLGDTSDGLHGIKFFGKTSYNTWVAEVLSKIPLDSMSYDEQIRTLDALYQDIGASNKRHTIHELYQDAGIEDFKGLFDINIKLGRIMSDTSLLTPYQESTLMEEIGSIEKFDKIDEDICASTIASKFSQHTNVFGGAFELEPETYDIYREVCNARSR